MQLLEKATPDLGGQQSDGSGDDRRRQAGPPVGMLFPLLHAPIRSPGIGAIGAAKYRPVDAVE